MKQHLEKNVSFLPSVVEKIDVTEWLEVKQHSRMLYLKLNPKHVRIYDLQQHDVLKVKFLVVKKAPRDLDAKEE